MQQMWQVRQVIALAMLAICVYTDIRERMIYMMPLIISASGAVIISVVSVFAVWGNGMETLWHLIVFPTAAGILLMGFSYVYRDRIGTGDGCLLAALGMILGNRYNFSVIMYSLISVFLFSIISVIVGRRRRPHSIPFAPFVMAGFLVVLISEI